jgi:hypothetical protein
VLVRRRHPAVGQEFTQRHRPIFDEIRSNCDGLTHNGDPTGTGCGCKGMPVCKFWVLVGNDRNHREVTSDHLGVFSSKSLELNADAHLEVFWCNFVRNQRALWLVGALWTIYTLLPLRSFGLLRPRLAVAMIARPILI